MPGTVEQLRRRPDVDDRDIDDIIGIAVELQEVARRDDRRASVEDVERVAAELDIDPAFVESAIAELQSRREQARAQEAQAAIEAAAASAARQRWLRRVAAGLVALLLLSGGGLGAMGALGAGTLRAADARVDQAEAALVVVLDRQASLAPQLIALSGSDDAGVAAAARRLQEARGVEEKLAASQALDQALSGAIGRLPPSEGAVGQQRLDLQHEVVGLTNRITVERRRVEEARADVVAAQQSLTGRAALWTGLAGE